MDKTTDIHSDDINVLEYWKVVASESRLISMVVGGVFVLSVIASLLLPKVYSSTASVLPPQQDNGLGAGMLSSQIAPGLGGLASGFLGIKSPSEIWIGVLNSRSVKDAVVETLDLVEVYGADSVEGARRKLSENVSIKKNESGIIFITAEDRDPGMAAKIANTFVLELDAINKRISMTSGMRTRLFVEKRLNETKIELARVEEEIKAFQEQNGAIKLDDQSKAIIDAIGRVKGELMAKEVQLKTMLSYATPDNPYVEVLNAEVSELRAGLRELEYGGASEKDIFIPASKVPELGLRYVRLLREAKVQETLYELLTRQYEMARIQEAKDSPTVQVLDHAVSPEDNIKPRRPMIVLLSTFVALFGVLGVVFFRSHIQRLSSRKHN